MNCSVARALDIVGDPWTLLVVRDMFWGYHRFGEFHERLGIARNTLTDRLAVLVDNGIAHQKRYQENPPRFEYHLTTKGQALGPIILTLMQWGDQWSGIEEPPVHLVDTTTGLKIAPLLVDGNTGTALRDLAFRSVHVDESWGEQS